MSVPMMARLKFASGAKGSAKPSASRLSRLSMHKTRIAALHLCRLTQPSPAMVHIGTSSLASKASKARNVVKKVSIASANTLFRTFLGNNINDAR